MSSPIFSETLREITVRNPEAIPVFGSLGIDYCCGGEQTLATACQKAGVAEDQVLSLLAATAPPRTLSAAAVANHVTEPIEKLIEHILDAHHAYIRRETPRLETLFDKVVQRHGERHPELKMIRDTFVYLKDELEAHLFKEENVLFPLLVNLAKRAAGARDQPTGGVSATAPISRMRMEHEDAGKHLSEMRTLSGNYDPPEDACTSYRALYEGLKEFERDLHRHIHLENNILFPRAAELEAEELSRVRT
jgi:regulator of cell morphogenesis and NO signaling